MNNVSKQKQNNENVNLEKIPELRFPEFKDNWNYSALEKVSTVKDGTHDSPKYHSEGYPLVTSKNLLKNGNLDLTNINLISKEDFDKINKRSKVDNGDILFGMIGTIGNPTIVNTSNFAIKNVALIKEEDKLKNNFLIHVLNSAIIEKQFYKLNAGGTQKFIALNLIRNLQVPVPSLEEQNKISKFLGLIDNKIEFLEKTLSLYQKHEQGIREGLFKNLDKKYGSLKLKEISSINKGNQLNKSNMIENGKYYVLNGGKEPSGYTDSWNVKENTITISEGGNSCGFVSFNNQKFYCGGHCYYLNNISENINVMFLFYYLKFKEKEIMKLRVGSGLPNIQKRDIENINILVPPSNTQRKIGDFLNNLNIKIQLNKNELNLLNIFKKGLLQKMFI